MNLQEIGDAMIFVIAWITVLLALAFMFTNGFQDASAIAATFIASRSATPRQGIILVAAMGLLGALLGGSAVAFTISGLLSIEPDTQLVFVLLSAVTTATIWNLVTWKFGLPSSSTHSLLGGLIGAGIASGGAGCISWGIESLLFPPHELTGFFKVLVYLVISVILGFIGGYGMRTITRLVLRNAKRNANRTISRFNWIAAGAMAFSNGANDSQKQMGIIALVLLSAGLTASTEVPLWTRAACALLLFAGTLSGGWRIMATLGRRIFRIEPVHSFDSQVSSGAIITTSTLAGAPVSSSHVISMSVIGVGAADNPRKIQWSVGKEILIAMVLTIPATMVLSFILSSCILTCAGGPP